MHTPRTLLPLTWLALAACSSEAADGGSSSDFLPCDEQGQCEEGVCSQGLCRTDIPATTPGDAGAGGTTSAAGTGGTGGASPRAMGGASLGGTPNAAGGAPTGAPPDGEGTADCRVEGADWAPRFQALECEVFDAINALRARGFTCPDGAPIAQRAPLRMHPTLRDNAREHSQDMTENDYFEFVDSLGRDVFTWAVQNYPNRFVRSSIVLGPTSGADFVALVSSSPPDCEILMSQSRYVGVGFHTNVSPTPDGGTPDAGAALPDPRNYTLIYGP